MKKVVTLIVTAMLAIALICGVFYYANVRFSTPSVEEEQLTEVEKLITKDLDTGYPATPREVIKLYNRIITAYYSQTMTDQELKDLTKQAHQLFDQELADNNPIDDYLTSVKADIEIYQASSKLISQSNVCDSNDVLYLTDGDDQLAYVDASYFMKEDSNYSRTYETYVLRKDADGNWKILVYYQTQPKSDEEE